MERLLLAWARLVSSEEYFNEYGNRETRPSVMILQEYETSVRRGVSLIDGFRTGGVQHLYSKMSADEFLDFIDFLVFKVAGDKNVQQRELRLAYLEKILADAGSEWRVGTRDGHAALEKRVPEGVAIAATEVIQQNSTAGALLGEAWHAAYGRSPDTEEAYEKAIKAVEEAGAAKVSPKNSKTTLGTMVRDMKAQGDWKLPVGSAEADAPVRMAEGLWQGQESRHGGNGYRKPTQEEAEAAVLLAVPLVQWFTSGVLARRP